jgi:hypothetical protein
VKMRSTIGSVMVALLAFASPVQAMCGQCLSAITLPNCHTSRIESPRSSDSTPEALAGEHCQHLNGHLSHQVGQYPASTSSGPAFHVSSTQLCQDRPCQGLLDVGSNRGRREFTRIPHSSRSLASAARSGDRGLAAQDPLQSSFARPPLAPLANQPLSIRLRI